MSSVDLEEVAMHALYHQNTIFQYIVTNPILDLFLEAEQRLGSKIAQR